MPSAFRRRLIGWPIGSDAGSVAEEGQALTLSDSYWQGQFMGGLYGFEGVTITQGAGTITPLVATVETVYRALNFDTGVYTFAEVVEIEVWYTFDAGTAGDAGDPVTITFDDFTPVDDVPLTGRHAGTGYVVLDGIHRTVHALWDAPGVIVMERTDGSTDLIGVDPNAGLTEGDVISLQLRRRSVSVIGS